MVIFRENSEDIYAGIEWKADSADAEKVIKFLREEMGVKKIRFRNIVVSVLSRVRKKAPNVWFVQQSNTQLLTIVTL